MSLTRVGLSSSLRRSILTPSHVRSQVSLVLQRNIQTHSLPPSAATEILNKQRLQRPSSPWNIYQPQMSSVVSIAHRGTGIALTGLLYVFSLSYLFVPSVFDSVHVLQFIGDLPEALKWTAKGLLAAPFSLHCWNGVRHLVWDSGKFLDVKGMYSTGYATLGATAVTTIALLLL